MDRTTIFIDYQNVHCWAHDLFCDYGTPLHECLVHPVKIAELILDRRRRESEIQEVRVYRGRPDSEKQSGTTAANDAQASAWLRDRRVVMIRRQLNYRGWPDDSPREKGIDVALAVDFVRLAMKQSYDVGILMSSDSDLLPALETVYQERLAHVEVATWSGAKSLRFSGENRPWCHFLSEPDFEAVRDFTDYRR